MMAFSSALYDIVVLGICSSAGSHASNGFLTGKHLFLISDCAESVLELVRLVDERPQDVVELLSNCLVQRCC